MNDRVLNEKESLELIAQMIQNTKSRMTRNSGAPFLIWGYTTIIVSLLVWFLLKETGNYHWQWLWFLLPAISLPSTLWIEHKQPKMIKTYIDRIVGYVWAVFGLGGFFVYRQYVLYKRDNEDLFYICKLMYDYDMLRDFIQSTLNINLEDAKVKALIAKYKSKEDKEKLSSIWEVSTSTVSDKYGAIFRRLKKY